MQNSSPQQPGGMPAQHPTEKSISSTLKKVYLYTVSLITLVMITIGAIMLLYTGLKTFIFTKTDQVDMYAYMPCPANIDSAETNKLPECSDPNYLEKQRELAQERTAARRQETAATALAMLIVATPIFYYHWNLIRKEV